MIRVECKHAPKMECTASTQCTPIINGYSCPRLTESGVVRFFNPARDIAVLWAVSDVRHEREDLTEEQAMEVLEYVSDNHDASCGVTWDTLRTAADQLFPKTAAEE